VSGIRYEFDAKPASGDTMRVAGGITWLRMPLPFPLDHINLWIMDDGDACTVIDTGIASDESRDVWRRTAAEGLGGRPIGRVIATHLHPDHIGCAGWLCREHDVELWMTREEYMLARVLVADTGRPAPPEAVRFYTAAGYSAEQLAGYCKRFGFFGRMVSPLPESYVRLHGGDLLQLGDHEWEVLIGRGHSPEHACLFCRELNVLVSGDQVLPSISANVGVWPTEPAANPLRYWFETLRQIRARLPEDVLVLPAHGRPFRGAHARIDELIAGHEQRLERLLEGCGEPRRAVDTFPLLFNRDVPASQLIMATGEALAHLHYLMSRGELRVEHNAGVDWFRRS